MFAGVKGGGRGGVVAGVRRGVLLSLEMMGIMWKVKAEPANRLA